MIAASKSSALIALKNGDFSYRIPVKLTDTDGKIADVINEIASFEHEATVEIERVSKEVRVEGKLSTRANLISANGSWKKKIIPINDLIINLTTSLVEMIKVINAISKCDLSQT